MPVPSEPQRRRADVDEIELIGGVEKRELVIVDYDPRWPDDFEQHAARIRSWLDDVAVDVEHIGSTSVPGLAAKPIIDILVTVPDITSEDDYVLPLVAAGYELRVREPGHRMLRTPALDVHVHVLEPSHAEGHDQLLFRDHLRTVPEDRDLYESTKRQLIQRDWPDMNAYADAKSDVITTIKNRARARSTKTE